MNRNSIYMLMLLAILPSCSNKYNVYDNNDIFKMMTADPSTIIFDPHTSFEYVAKTTKYNIMIHTKTTGTTPKTKKIMYIFDRKNNFLGSYLIEGSTECQQDNEHIICYESTDVSYSASHDFSKGIPCALEKSKNDFTRFRSNLPSAGCYEI